ncbi:hypothetical protein G4D82_14265 [Flavobacterium sp. CYK-4]|uniref:hypothetical protein n=1 Tax=Flavobacterium lotistagni TaxID=2709660 RepID=UPI00140DF105|nr:hypothetical protein [Flavobacterium lotistagni]NHM08385.1 hypothetical protein [Flavobacterium lotistagni]
MKSFLTLFLICIFLVACNSFEIEKKVVGKYYVIKNEGITTLNYKLENGAYVGKIPATLIEYGFNQKYIVGKTVDTNNLISYYIILREKDFDLAIEDNFRIGPIAEDEYTRNWKRKLKIKLYKIEE